jgi:3-hydroxyacyl-CoA dehydrogenase
VVTDTTAPDVTATVFDLARKIRKIPVRAGVCDGFIGNRILTKYRKACEYLVLDGADFDRVDRALERFGFAMGPFAVGDLAGLDIAKATRDRKAATRPAEERYSRIADLMCDQGWFGRKTGQGYYVYDGAKNQGVNSGATQIMQDERAAVGLTAQEFTEADIVDRCITAMIAEGTQLLEDGIALRPVDIDAVELFGYGFPRHHGGPMHLADQIGAQVLVDRIEAYATEDAHFWRVPALLRQMATDGRRFADLNTERAQP